jgi:hypothetical protein
MRDVNLIAWLVALACSAALHAAEEPWLNPPGGTWTPDRAVVYMMKVDFDAAIPAKLGPKVTASAAPTQYWFQYQGAGSESSRTILLYGFPGPVPPRAGQDLFNVFIPEACTIFAIYVPSERRFDRLEVGGLGCPPRI